MKKKLLKDSWFQMFTAIAGTAYVVSALGTASTRRVSTPASPPPVAPAAAKSAAAPAAAADAASGPVAEGAITPPPRSSSDLATYSGALAANALDLVAPPSPAVPPGPAAGANPPAPKMTLTGTGVGNTQGIVGPGVNAGGGMGRLNGLLGRLMGGAQPQAAMQAQPQFTPLNRVAPARPGIFTVGPFGTAGADTSSLRDAVFSAASGDLILVKPGTYEGPVEVLNKSVRIRGTGSNPIDVKVIWAGRGATIGVRNGTLGLEKIWIERHPDPQSSRTEPGGAVYAVASTLSMRNVDLVSFDAAAPALIVEQGDKSTHVTADDCHLSGATADMAVRGPVRAKFTQVFFASVRRPIVAWIDAVIELADCSFDGGGNAVIVAYEGARVSVKGKQKPRIDTTRGSDATSIEEMFGVKRAAIARGGFSRDIFRRGRRPGTLP